MLRSLILVYPVVVSFFTAVELAGNLGGGAPSGTDFDEIPTQTNILGAAKVTGRSANGFSFGALGALTGRESGKAFTQSTNSFQNFIVEPRTQYGVLSMKQDFRTGATQVGAISTLIHRDLPTNGSFDYLTSNAVSLGIDFDHNWGGESIQRLEFARLLFWKSCPRRHRCASRNTNRQQSFLPTAGCHPLFCGLHGYLDEWL